MDKVKIKKKKCPRCGCKTFLEGEICPGCGLKYKLLQNLSNVRAKEEIKAKHKQNVLYVTSMPSDVNKKKFWLLFAFLGIFGAHNIYVGKYGRGYYTLVTAILAFLAFMIYEIVFFQAGWVTASYVEYYFTSPIITFYVFGLLVWFSDSISLMFKTFKYPATLNQETFDNVIANKIRGR